MMIIKNSEDCVLSLFSGAGGFSLGFSMAGLKPIAGIEINRDACETYRHNIGSPCHEADINSLEPQYLKSLTGNTSPFVIIGGPPCQGFSTAGNRQANDPRNKLIFSYLNIVETLKPRWFIFENVEGVLTSGSGQAIVGLASEFIRIGYSIRIQKVNFAGYGLPQTRKRVLIIGNRVGIDFVFPKETHSYKSGKSKKSNGKPLAPTFDEATAGLGMASSSKDTLVGYESETPSNRYDSFMRRNNQSKFVTMHYHTTTEQDTVKFSQLKCGETMKDLPEELWHESFKRRANRRVKDGTPTEKRGGAPSGIKRLFGNLNCLTITGAASREFIHPHYDRALTLRECARIQSFPDCFEFHGNSASQAQQIGNAVPPLMASIFAKHLIEVDGKFGSSRSDTQHHVSPRLLGFQLTEASGMSPALELTYRNLEKLVQTEMDFS
ncbi:DNA cytosine methyltransferase [Desulfuromonas sp. KJ2020]|uniref:DNA cytosine methyltransferase n=1 Tax=Desulfuromonas sp. KJ2020 TaxID=2919173 RepID=UPI0020A73A1D|nr:DNA cytosine methyltransferase [Desulfuromonas sp. KJ2020]MCP3176102.1 DNA cytosine methyltransferase [Desulfuromonas sp. KJ2020]